MANQYRLGNQRNEETSPYRNAIYLRLFESNIRIINGGPRSVSSIPVIGGQNEPVARSDYQRSGVVAGNSSNVNSIFSFNDGINTTTTGTRNDELFRANSLFKRSRSPDPFARGETSNQGSQVEGSSSRRRTLPPPFHLHQDNINMSSSPRETFWDTFLMNEDDDVDAGPSSATTRSEINSPPHVKLFLEGHVNQIPSPTIAHVWPSNSVPPRQPITTSDTLSSNNYRLNPHLSLGSIFTIAAQTARYIQTSLGSPRLENVASHGGIHNNLFSTSRELRPERNRLRVEMIEWRLREEEIFLYIQHKTYRPNTEKTSTMNQTCIICQEDYIDGEHIGRLHCTHTYHFDCIKQWLVVKNVCPI